jgi:hypothetical protein
MRDKMALRRRLRHRRTTGFSRIVQHRPQPGTDDIVLIVRLSHGPEDRDAAASPHDALWTNPGCG